MPGMTLREDRILRYVTAFCPECHNEAPDRPLEEVERLGGYLSEEGGRVWLVRGCPTHGRIRTLYDEDAEILGYLEEWTAPTKRHTPDTRGNFDPVPLAYLKGLGEMQTQHTCVLLEDVVAACNLRCPTCFSDSSPDLAAVVPPAPPGPPPCSRPCRPAAAGARCTCSSTGSRRRRRGIPAAATFET